jgi:acyl carrier protein
MGNEATLEWVVHRGVAKAVGHRDFEAATRLRMLGLERQAIEDLLFRLEDELDVTVSPGCEDRFVGSDPTVGDLVRFVQGL